MCARETFVGFPLRVQSKAALARRSFLQCKKLRAEEHAKKSPPGWVVSFGAGDEARLATGIPRMAEPFAGALPHLLI